MCFHHCIVPPSPPPPRPLRSTIGMNLSPKKLKVISKLIRQSQDFLNVKAYNFTGFLPQYYGIYSPQSRASNTLRYTIGEKMVKTPVFKWSTSENKAICTPSLSFPFELEQRDNIDGGNGGGKAVTVFKITMFKARVQIASGC